MHAWRMHIPPLLASAEQIMLLVQVEAACQVPWLSEIILDFLEVHGLKEAVSLVRHAGKKCIIGTPRCAALLWLLCHE